MQKKFSLLFFTVFSLLLITACENEMKNPEINIGEKFIKELYNIDKPSIDIDNSSPEELIEFQNKFSSYFTKEEFTNLANIRFFLIPQEVSNKQNIKISVEDISFIKNDNNQKEKKETDFDFTFTLILKNQNEDKIDEIEINGQMSIIESNNKFKISRYYDSEPLKDVLYKTSP